MATRRDLDRWALGLGVINDADAIDRLTWVARETRAAKETLSFICDALRGVDERGLAALAADRLDVASDAVYEALRGFYAHERGRG